MVNVTAATAAETECGGYNLLRPGAGIRQLPVTNRRTVTVNAPIENDAKQAP